MMELPGLAQLIDGPSRESQGFDYLTDVEQSHECPPRTVTMANGSERIKQGMLYLAFHSLRRYANLDQTMLKCKGQADVFQFEQLPRNWLDPDR